MKSSLGLNKRVQKKYEGIDLDKAIETAYNGVKMVSFKDAHFRKDIGIKKY